MINIIDMQDLRHLNLFRKVTKIQTRYCFKYNEILMFCVPRREISKALGKNGENLKKMSDIIKRRVRIIPIPNGIEDAKSFISSVIAPVGFKEIEITPKEVIVNAGSENKAALLGRNRRRFSEMKKIIKDFFNLDYRII
jgi:NusA-like KH domain protein